MFRRILWQLLTVSVLGYIGWYAGAYWRDHSATLCHITFVPLGDFSDSVLEDLASQYQRTLGVRIDVHSPIALPESVIDYPREQLVGERLIGLVKEQLPQLEKDRSALVVGFTRGDMYIAKMNWRFAFAIRESGRFAVISTARMDPVSFGLAADEALLRTRLLKMVMKTIGLYFYGLTERHEKTSVLYSPILGVDDLDDVSMEFDATDLQRMAKLVKSCQR